MPSSYRQNILATREHVVKSNGLGATATLILFIGGMVTFFVDANPETIPDTASMERQTFAMTSPVFRFEVRLPPGQVPSISRCVGTWLHPRWILSAAHCVPSNVSHLYPVIADSNHPSTKDRELPALANPALGIVQTILHPREDLAIMQSVVPYTGPILGPSIPSKPLAKDTWSLQPSVWIVPSIDTASSSKHANPPQVQARLTLSNIDAHTLRFKVTTGDLNRGDSGAPIFLETNDGNGAKGAWYGILMAGSPDPQGWQTAQRIDHLSLWLQQSMQSST